MHVVLQVPQVLAHVLYLILLHICVVITLTVEDGGEFVKGTIIFEPAPGCHLDVVEHHVPALGWDAVDDYQIDSRCLG